jgi:hypothetical protein
MPRDESSRATGREPAAPRARLRAELERHGVAPELAEAVAAQLAELAPMLPDARAEDLVAGAALACAVHGARQSGGSAQAARDLEEVQRLMTAFVGELRKLDEALQLLATYLSRIKARTAPAPSGPLH